ncbi:cyclic nucleotide-binding protein [Microvirga sp. KLBC 81]|uniref:Crp/Fnr family transcriptional regulator n=1 Tax=Microvirga sp. KLBC 81 TaxID=1862707 RepID=UPI000D508BE1|nr:Crp/Fnr family transcriptional regulator [Microvirga sp. KLBC 81]PVE24786.1 cyclic nucleotide-binding protein [Microvirga sp. KLBC 81]
MAIHLIRKLEHFTKLSSEEKTSLERTAAQKVRQLNPREDIVYEGDRPSQINLILEGWACRYKVLEDGRRQIMGYSIPGDICDMRMFILKEMDHSIGAITPVSLAEIPKDTIIELTDTYPRLSRAFWWDSLVENAISREWIVNNSQREATERMAHLFCELFIRLRMVGLTRDHSCEIPVTQADLGETLGLSTVHVNRTLQELRASNLIVLKGKALTIPDLEALQEVALFNDNYLHLNRDGHEMDANE